jgi:hypothetical protein
MFSRSERAWNLDRGLFFPTIVSVMDERRIENASNGLINDKICPVVNVLAYRSGFDV